MLFANVSVRYFTLYFTVLKIFPGCVMGAVDGNLDGTNAISLSSSLQDFHSLKIMNYTNLQFVTVSS